MVPNIYVGDQGNVSEHPSGAECKACAMISTCGHQGGILQ